ncbi:MAG TPA: family 16 glycoside hydrolase [Xanthobacteraceae bacterium]|nr:family 16 glycoside hydrolase [Xanthobacteraceae bacterium]
MFKISRRRFITTTALGAAVSVGGRFARSAGPGDAFDLTQSLDGWETISGKWTVEDVPGASRGGRALVQRSTGNEYNVIVAPGGPYRNVGVSVRFKPMSGQEDASGGIVIRLSEGRYYVVRANALEDNFRFYYYDGSRHMLTSTNVAAPALGDWHKLQILATGDRFQGWLNDRELIDHRDDRFAAGRIGLWTKADSVTAFDALTVLSFDAG